MMRAFRSETVRPVSVFISYSHRDDQFRAELDNHLKLLHRVQLIDIWHDRRITPGNEWQSEVDTDLENAELVLLLVSSDFLASDYC
jgi:hypothetical protein